MDRMKKILDLLKEQPSDEFLNYALAQEFHGQEKYQKAIEQYNRLKEINAEYVGLYYHLAECLALSGAKSEALMIYDEGIVVAKRLNDQHALSELQNARMNLEMDLI